MSAEQQVNRNEAQAVLETVLVSSADTNAIAEELFGVADLLHGREDIARALTDPARPAADKQALARQIFASYTQAGTLEVLEKLASLHWRKIESLLETLEVLAVRALLAETFKNDQLWQVEQELRDVRDLFRTSRDLRSVVSSHFPGSRLQRAEFVGQILEGKVLPVTSRLARRAVYRSEGGRVMSSLLDYAYEAAHLRGQYLYTVTSARELTQEQFSRLHDLLQQKMGKPIILTQVVDPELIGGFRVMSANHVVEASVSADLVNLRKTLKR